MINKKILSILTICILSILVLNISITKSNAQSDSVLFEETIIKKIGVGLYDVCFKTIKDGNDYVSLIGSDSLEINGCDSLIVKLDSNLNILKEKYLNGEGNDYINDIIKTKTGYIAIGSSNSVSITGNALLKEDGWIIELDKDLNVIKQIMFGGTGDDEFVSIKEVEDGYILIGNTNSSSINEIYTKGGSDILLVKLNKDLSIAKTSILGGDSDEYHYLTSNVINTENGLLFDFVTNSSNILDLETIGVSSVNKDAVIVEVDKDLNILNKKIFGGNGDDVIKSMVKVSNGYVFIGSTNSSDIEAIDVGNNSSKYFIVELDNNFSLIKTKYLDLEYNYLSLNMLKTNNGYKAFGSAFYQEAESEPEAIGLLILDFDNEFNLVNKKFSSTFSEINYDLEMYYSFLLNEGESVLYGLIYDISNDMSNDTIDAVIKKVRYLYKNSQSIGLEIVADNSLEMSISTNKISFEGYNGVEDLTNDNLNLTVSSGLYYDLYATLDSEIRGTNDTNAIIDKANLKIKTSDDIDYKSFVNIGEKVNLVANHKNGKDILHNINLKLLKDSSVKADTYNTNITFEVIQK